ncbi:hypothetical protein ACT1U9_30205 [Streptomyces sp. BR1]
MASSRFRRGAPGPDAPVLADAAVGASAGSPSAAVGCTEKRCAQ